MREIFTHFQNLNLLALLHDLRQAQTARQAWSSFDRLCPLAHGLPSGEEVRRINYLGTAASFGHSCDVAARSLGAPPAAIRKFVSAWDERSLTRERLATELEAIWAERVADAEAVQEMLLGSHEQSIV